MGLLGLGARNTYNEQRTTNNEQLETDAFTAMEAMVYQVCEGTPLIGYESLPNKTAAVVIVPGRADARFESRFSESPTNSVSKLSPQPLLRAWLVTDERGSCRKWPAAPG